VSALAWLFTIPIGAFLLLLGLFWEPSPISRKDKKLEKRLAAAHGTTPELAPVESSLTDTDSSGEKPKMTSLQVRRYLRLLAERAFLIILGGFGILVGIIDDLGSIDDMDAFALLFAIYAGMILLVQRVERKRKILTLWFMGFAAWLTWRTAEYREVPIENNWAVLAALGATFLFWLLIGRRFPPGTSDVIEVYGME
jgi:hypothetical protein